MQILGRTNVFILKDSKDNLFLTSYMLAGEYTEDDWNIKFDSHLAYEHETYKLVKLVTRKVSFVMLQNAEAEMVERLVRTKRELDHCFSS